MNDKVNKYSAYKVESTRNIVPKETFSLSDV